MRRLTSRKHGMIRRFVTYSRLRPLHYVSLSESGEGPPSSSTWVARGHSPGREVLRQAGTMRQVTSYRLRAPLRWANLQSGQSDGQFQLNGHPPLPATHSVRFNIPSLLPSRSQPPSSWSDGAALTVTKSRTSPPLLCPTHAR